MPIGASWIVSPEVDDYLRDKLVHPSYVSTVTPGKPRTFRLTWVDQHT
jgi:hypothetical protein